MQLPTVENKLSEFDARLSRIEGITEQIATRLTSLEQKVELGFSETRQTARTYFRWLIGILISTQLTTLITLGTLILVKLG
ncbi:MAG: hypothetical protein OXI94_20620 [Gemmatimonadota bacterium]|nr:hypothetical protein [Gemmatimonadota bacterium]